MVHIFWGRPVPQEGTFLVEELDYNEVVEILSGIHFQDPVNPQVGNMKPTEWGEAVFRDTMPALRHAIIGATGNHIPSNCVVSRHRVQANLDVGDFALVAEPVGRVEYKDPSAQITNFDWYLLERMSDEWQND